MDDHPPMDLATALEVGREQATEYPEGPWPTVLAELNRLQAAVDAAQGEIDGIRNDYPEGWRTLDVLRRIEEAIDAGLQS